MGDSPWGQNGPDPYCVVSDLGCGHRGVCCFLIVHALYLDISPSQGVCEQRSPADRRAHSRACAQALAGGAAVSLDHGRLDVHAAVTAFLPKVGVQFNWVTYHWIAGAGADRIDPLSHRSRVFLLDFWSIWPDKIDLRDACRRMLRFFGQGRAAAGQVRQVSVGEQAVSRRDRAAPVLLRSSPACS